MMIGRNKKQQKRATSILEYCVTVAVVVFALVGFQIYLKRAICGRWRQSVDTFGYGRQYNGLDILH